MRVLFCGLKYEYGRPELGLSTIEYQNFFGTLQKMENLEAEFFAVDEIMKKFGRDEMNTQLIRQVEEKQPDLLFCLLFTEEIKKQTIDYITKKTKTKTFNWFADDHWRFFNFSKLWASLFTAIGTTDSLAPARYKALGINNVIKTQWAANTFMFHPAVQSTLGWRDIAFLGKNYGKRGKYIQRLKAQNLQAQGFGKGWDGGVVDFEKMLEIFSFSKINLNFTASPYTTFTGRLKLLSKFILRKELGKYRANFQFPISNFQTFLGAQRNQIKARTFEIPACGGFLLTEDADNLKDYFVPDKEAAIFRSFPELVEKCKFYLTHEPERQAIAKAGYERVLREHTYVHRFKEIFKTMGLM